MPLSDAVASNEPVELRLSEEIGVLCAWMILVTLSESRSNIRTSPGDVCEGVDENGELGEGTGEGYAR